MAVSLRLVPGKQQIVLEVPWDGNNVTEIVSAFRDLLKQSPNKSPIVFASGLN